MTSTTSAGGNFTFNVADYCKSSRLVFENQSGKMLLDTVIGPFASVGLTVPISFKFDVKTNTIQKNSVQKPGLIKLLAASAEKGVVVAYAGTAVSQGEIQIYSMNGVLIRKLLFNCHGAGTYTINWDEKNGIGQSISSGNYTFRVIIGKDALCTRTLSWQ